MRIVDLLPAAPIANAEHAETLLELAYLMTAADGRFTDEERRAFGELATRMGGASVDARIARFAQNVAGGSIADRVRAIGPTLPMELREVAFKIGIRLALVDHDAAKEEDLLMNVFFETLGLDPERAETLAAEARGTRAP
jgi:tellurite resistance protein